MKFTILVIVIVTLLGILQFSTETYAVPIPPSYPPIDPYAAYCNFLAMQGLPPPPLPFPPALPALPPLAPPALPPLATPALPAAPVAAPIAAAPAALPPAAATILPAAPGAVDGLTNAETTVGDGNINFTGFNVLGNTELPLNLLSITELLGK